jgi:hypothetical protein
MTFCLDEKAPEGNIIFMLPMVLAAVPPEAVIGVILLSRSARIAIEAVAVWPLETETFL